MENFERFTKIYWDNHNDEHQDIINENYNRIIQGAEVWNEWARAFNTWLVKNEVEGYISFRSCTFERGTDFSDLIFPTEVTFINAEFKEIYTDFRNARFSGDVNFTNAKFNCDSVFFESVVFSGGNVSFSGAEFYRAYFQNAEFSGGNVSFRDAEFKSGNQGNTDFSVVKFSGGDVDFSGVKFNSRTSFHLSEFSGGDVIFREAEFSGERIDFTNVKFCDGIVSFASANFSGRHVYFNWSNFSGENVNFSKTNFSFTVDFSYCEFSYPPNFISTSFDKPPLLSPIKLKFQNYKQDIKLVEKYRLLKKFAIEAKDHESEMKYFGFEKRALANLKSTKVSEKIFINLYHEFSNLGQSILRPFSYLIVFLYILFTINFNILIPKSQNCINDESKFSQIVAIYTLNSALPLMRIDKTQSEEIRGCLFGKTQLTLSDNLWSTLHFLIGTLFLFLFGLGVRNRFKIK